MKKLILGLIALTLIVSLFMGAVLLVNTALFPEITYEVFILKTLAVLIILFVVSAIFWFGFAFSMKRSFKDKK